MDSGELECSVDEYVIGSDESCDHPEDRIGYLGHNGVVSFFQCERCEAVVIRAPSDE